MRNRIGARILLVGIVVLTFGFVASAFLPTLDEGQSTVPRDQTGETTGLTAITTAAVVGTNNSLVVVDGNGNTVYSHFGYSKYFDVDPVENRSGVLEFVAGKDFPHGECPAPEESWTATKKGCTRNDIVRVNISTGESTVLYSRYTDWRIWHDVDRIADDKFLVADIENNRVFVVNTSSGIIEWEWEAQSDVAVETGGGFPLDWTHLNDVELLDDGRIMVSLRNQDRVVFLTREEGIQHEWTLGEEDNRSIMFEQHNPDFIPAERGGPAVLVADSGNGRVLEFQREGDEWVRTWVWSTPDQRWTRDVDRLPNGNTLITNSNGNEVMEIDRDGDVIWSLTINTPYESERLSTGDESAGGVAASTLDLPSRGNRQVIDDPSVEAESQTSASILDFLPERLVDSVLFVTPVWMNLRVIAALLTGLGTMVLWGIAELYWSGYRLEVVRKP